jgi:hypothetical protein
MKTEEDEAFETIERRQGAGGFHAKQNMAMHKTQDQHICRHYKQWQHCHICDLEAQVEELKAQLAQPAQELVAQWLEDAFREGWEAYRESEFASKITEDWAFGNSFANCRIIDLQQNTPPLPAQRPWIWLSDADIAEVVDTTCQYTGSYEEFLIKKAERKIRSMNHGT